jgi:hypothetical protein
MSLQSWKEEFYPVDANSEQAREAPVAHSLLKWEGLTERNLGKHSVRRDARNIADEKEYLFIDSESCALCKVHLHLSSTNCEACPIVRYRGEPCDTLGGEYGTWSAASDPRPMINLLRAVKEAGYD